jgi:hypothetical protein
MNSCQTLLFKFDLRRYDAVLTLAVRNSLVAGAPGQNTGLVTPRINVVLSNKLLAEHVWQGVIIISQGFRWPKIHN